MTPRSELGEFFEERAQTYLFLSQIFFKELTAEAIEQMAVAEYPTDCGNENLDQGYALIRRYFKFNSNDPRTQLACEYARIFLATSVFGKNNKVAVPYESVFTSEEGLVMQESRDEVVRIFAEDGFKIDPDLHEPDDHLAFELEYLSVMNARASQLLVGENWEELIRNIERQQSFVEAHLLNWLGDLTEIAQEYAQLTFYIGMLLITQGYLQESRTYLAQALATMDETKNDTAA